MENDSAPVRPNLKRLNGGTLNHVLEFDEILLKAIFKIGDLFQSPLYDKGINFG